MTTVSKEGNQKWIVIVQSKPKKKRLFDCQAIAGNDLSSTMAGQCSTLNQFDHLLPGIWASKFHTRTCSANSESGPNDVQYSIHLFFWGTFSCDLSFFQVALWCNFWRYSDTTQKLRQWCEWPLRFDKGSWLIPPHGPWNLEVFFFPNPSTQQVIFLNSDVFPGVLHFNGYLGYVSPNVSICNHTLYTYLYYTYFASYLQDLGTRHFDIFSVVLSSTPLTDLWHWQVTPHCAVQDVPGMRSKLLAAGSRPEV